MTIESPERGLEATHPFVFDDVEGYIEDPRRLHLLRSTGLLAERDNPALEVITHLAGEMTEARAMVSLVEVDRQVFPSSSAPEGQPQGPAETPISHSLCQYVVINDAPLIVEDARMHAVLSSHPAVVDGAVVAYAGFPVRAPDGEVLGALCVLDLVPRTWTPAHLSGLRDLASAVDTKIALRLSLKSPFARAMSGAAEGRGCS